MGDLINGGELFAPAGEDPTATLSVIVGDASIITIRSRIEVRFVELAPQVCFIGFLVSTVGRSIIKCLLSLTTSRDLARSDEAADSSGAMAVVNRYSFAV
jgi:hypothetical protein